MVLTNPPFGKKSSTTIIGEEGKASRERDIVERGDFWTTTSNKQLNFVQHVKTLLKQNGRAAVVVPDNVLFEGSAGETIRRKLLHECDVHTLLRLPTGLFYAQGVKANVLFFDKKPASETPWTKKLWIYDLRTNMHFTLKTNPLKREDLDEFVKCYNPENRHDRQPTWSEDTVHPSTGSGRTGNAVASGRTWDAAGSGRTEEATCSEPTVEAVCSERAEEVAGSGRTEEATCSEQTKEAACSGRTGENASLTPATSLREREVYGRWRAYDYEELIKRDKISLDIFWLKDESLSDSDNLPAPDVIAQEIVDDLEAALAQFREILSDVEGFSESISKSKVQ